MPLFFEPVTNVQEDRDVYRRAARRLRASLRHDRPRLYRSLESLARRRDRRAHEAIERPADRFARMVESSLDGTVLRYSQRLNLLRRAKYFNLDRFEANLLIAAVQHRVKESDRPRRQLMSTRLAYVLIASALQSLILLAAYFLFAP